MNGDQIGLGSNFFRIAVLIGFGKTHPLLTHKSRHANPLTKTRETRIVCDLIEHVLRVLRQLLRKCYYRNKDKNDDRNFSNHVPVDMFRIAKKVFFIGI